MLATPAQQKVPEGQGRIAASPTDTPNRPALNRPAPNRSAASRPSSVRAEPTERAERTA